MAAGIGTLAIRLLVQAQEMQSGFVQAQRELQQFADYATHIVHQVRNTLATIGAGVGIAETLRAFKEDEMAGQRLTSVLNATGGAAGYSAQELKDFASELQKTTTFADEVTVSAMAVLATFDKIGGETFKRATTTAQNLATIMQTDLSSAAHMLGKALQNPEEGLARLSRGTVQFTESQKAMVKDLQDNGDMLGAQNYILDVLAGKLGTAAADAAQTFSGQIQIAKNQLGEFAEVVGGTVAPLLVTLASGLLTVTNYFVEHADVVMRIVRVLAIAAEAIIAYRGIMLTLVIAQKAVAAAQAVVLALSGPKGWAQLALGVAAGVAAVALVGGVMDDVAAKAEAAIQKTKEVSQATPKLTPFEQETKQHEEDYQKIVKPLLEQYRALGMNAEAITLYKAKQAGLNQDQVQHIGTLQRLIREEGEHQRIMAEGLKITEAAKNPLEKFSDELDKLDEALENQAISWETYQRAVAKATEDLEKASEASNQFKNPEGLAEGSKEATNAIIKFQTGGRVDPQKRVEEILKLAAEREKRIADNTEETVRQVAKNRDAIKKAKLF